MIGASERWPNMIASAMTSSGTIFAPASTIMIASRVPDTIEVEIRILELGARWD